MSYTYFDHSIAIAEPGVLNFVPTPINKENGTAHSCRCVAFRLDDVQDSWLTNAQVEIMKLFKNKTSALTIGIIGDEFEKNGRLVSSYVKERMANKNNSNGTAEIEIANHSWKHENFSKLTAVKQSDSIRTTNEKIKNIFGKLPTVFIPPFNEFNNDTIGALHENKMRYFTADTAHALSYSVYPNDTIYNFPKTAETGDCMICGEGVMNASWYGLPHEKTFYQINRSLSKYGFAVVMMHATEYSIGHDEWNFQNAVDWKQMMELELLIDKIRQEGLQIVTVGNLTKHFYRY